MAIAKPLYLLLVLTPLFVICCGYQNKEDKPAFPSELVDFKLSGEPVFSGTGTDTWDRGIRERGYILWEDSLYKMWYTGYNYDIEPTMHLGYATSPDGIRWTRYSGNPIFSDYWTEDVQLLRHEGKYYMVAEGEEDIAHLLTSTDGIHWQRQGDLDIRKVNGEPIGPGAYGTPTLWLEDGQWYLFYERGDMAVWLAGSTDTKVWTNIQDEPVIERGPEPHEKEGIALNQIIKYQGRYYGYYHGTPDKDWARWNSNVAMSEDLIHWTKYEGNPIVDVDAQHGNYSSPILVWDGEVYRLYTMHGEVRMYLHQQP
jgi:hypothetical protein